MGKSKIFGFLLISISAVMFVSCGGNELEDKDVIFEIKEHENKLDSSYDVKVDFAEDVGNIDVVIYVEDLSNKDSKEAKFASFTTTGKDEELGITVLNQPKGEYKYKLVAKDEKDVTIEKELTFNVTDKGKEEAKKEVKEDVKEVKYKPWDGNGIEYKKGNEVEFNNRMYQCIQDHKSQEDWTPSAAVSLWKEFKI